jgi:hypothetical protein
MAATYQIGDDSRIVLGANTADVAVVRGLNKLTLPDLTRSVIEVQEFGVDFDISFASGGKYGNITYGGNLMIGDTLGQDILKTKLKANTKITDVRFYFNYTTGHFLAADLANDTNAGFQVTKAGGIAGDKAGIYTYDGEMICNGQIAFYTIHMQDAETPTITFVQGSGADDTILDSGSGFVTAGFVAGQTIIIDGHTTNKGKTAVLKTVAAGTLTLDGEGIIETDATGEAATLIHGGLL